MLDLKHSNTSLPEVHETIDTSTSGKGWRKVLAFLGPAYLVSVGYMDPGNWATDIAGGSQFGYSLIWVLLMSNLMAVLLQSLSARLGIVRGRDLAQASRETYSRPVNLALYFLAEIAIAACDLAEVLGMAIGLNLLFHIPLLWGVCITVLDTFLLLFLINFGMRKMEAFIIALIAIIGLSFFAEMLFAQPDLGEVVKGFVPSMPNEAALYIAIGIIGATVMPHNLYLHSSLVQTRKFNRSSKEIRKAIRYNIFDSVIALNLAFFVNAAILVLAASTFFKNGMYEVAEIQDAHKFLEPLLGSKMAPALFAIALIASGQSSTLTGTLAGQIVMEGYLRLRIAPWIRRLLTRMIAIIPALITIFYFGEAATGKLLILSQVILSLQLGFAVIPLIHFVSDKSKMKEFVIPVYVRIAAWLSAIIIVGLNARLVYGQINDWLQSTEHPMVLWLTVVPIAGIACLLLLYITFRPLFKKIKHAKTQVPHLEAKDLVLTEPKPYRRIAVAVDFSKMDQLNISNAINQGGKKASYLLLHVVESAGALMMKQDIQDFEFRSDQKNMEKYVQDLKTKGYDASLKIGYGNPKKAIPELVNQFGADLLVMGAHGHRGFKDMILGTTVDVVRHRVHIPVLIVREENN
ncbi:MAG: Nramp family divalent metal transporter [Bacteroidetes bacterium]|nr:Nramp family divalent metal transporter [Bacteroidota bacterium]MBL0256140.1 Nramp family divalent metal transporter [Bacteroidota bacterium]MBP6401287.1 Nramp family divalent metal transporter [Bacteroidia bacterium]MBP6648193.1 Nramp family divalent metal transporter [Bacteroidia bacterium]